VASADGSIVSGAEDGTVRVWRANDGSLRAVLSGPPRAAVRALTMNTSRIVAAWDDGTVWLWTMDGEREAVLFLDRPAAALSLDSAHLTVVEESGRTFVYEVQ